MERLWEAYRAHHGRDGDPVLVWQADTRSMNPTADPAVIEAAYEADEAVAAAEYGAEFRRDIETFVAREAVAACVIPERFELPSLSTISYTGFTDPAGGSGGDSMTLAIAHIETQDGRRVAVLDVVREVRPPFSPEQVVAASRRSSRTTRSTALPATGTPESGRGSSSASTASGTCRPSRQSPISTAISCRS
jgi:hypothetical protein